MSNDFMITIAKSAPTRLNKAQWYSEIFKRSERQRPVGESQAIAFVRYIEKHPDGQILYRAYRQAKGPDWQPPAPITKVASAPQTAALSKLEKMAEELRAQDAKLTKEQAFAQVVNTPQGQNLYRQDRAERFGIAVA